MRLLYVLERYPELSQTFVAQELIGLQELGISVDVVALERGTGGAQPAPALWLSEVTPARRLSAAAKQALGSPLATTKQLLLEDSWPPPAATKRIRGLARLSPAVPLARRADQIHAHFATEATDIARLLSAASGTPYSFTAHAADAYSDRSALARNISAARFARGASPHVAQQLREAALDPTKVLELPIAVDTAKFAQLPAARQPGRVVAVGRLVEKKGFSDLIEAFTKACASAPEAELVIAGTGPLHDQLVAEAAATGAPISILGALSNTQVAELMATASIFALTPKTASDGDRDGRPAVIIEAMAAGLPVLATNQPGIPELVGHGSGLLATPGNVDEISLKLTQLLAMSAAQLEVMGHAGRSSVTGTYSRDTIARMLAAIFEAGLLSSSNSG